MTTTDNRPARVCTTGALRLMAKLREMERRADDQEGDCQDGLMKSDKVIMSVHNTPHYPKKE